MHIPDLLISGLQTGTDQGGLYGAWHIGGSLYDIDIATGGFAPKGYRTEDGLRPDIGALFGLVESESSDYNIRTDQNLRIADVLILIARDFVSPGTYLTKRLAWKYKLPLFEVPYPTLPSLESDTLIFDVRSWLEFHKPSVVMIAGNRESKARGIQRWTEDFVIRLFT